VKKISINYIKENKDFIISEIKSGKIFIYPTDTIYGIGCDATNFGAVKKIFEIKKRDSKPLLIIVPNKKWIFDNTKFNERHIDLIESKLPGPYSFIVKLKFKNLISTNILNGNDTIGVRIPKCYMSEIINEIGVPFVTTSVNISGEKAALSIDDIDDEILTQVDYVIESKENISGKSSTIIDIVCGVSMVLR